MSATANTTADSPWPPVYGECWHRGFIDQYTPREPTAPPEPEPFSEDWRASFIATLKADAEFVAACRAWLLEGAA